MDSFTYPEPRLNPTPAIPAASRPAHFTAPPVPGPGDLLVRAFLARYETFYTGQGSFFQSGGIAMDATEVVIKLDTHCDHTLMQYLWERSGKLEANDGLSTNQPFCDGVLGCWLENCDTEMLLRVEAL
jgi:hypothetical protein